MDYQTARSLAKDGDIFFFSPQQSFWGKLFADLMATSTKSKFVHSAIVFWYQDRLLLTESNFGGEIIVNASTYEDRQNIAIIRPNKTWGQLDVRALASVGTTKYNWLDGGYILLREYLFNHFSIKMPQQTTSARNFVCSEYVAYVLGLDDITVSPGELYLKLKNENLGIEVMVPSSSS